MTTRRNDGSSQGQGRGGDEGRRPSTLEERTNRPERGEQTETMEKPGENPGNTNTPSRRSGRGSNLSDQDRARGGERSAGIQRRDQFGQFAGVRGPDSGETQRGGAPQDQGARGGQNQ
jgi:hypothetical protein